MAVLSGGANFSTDEGIVGNRLSERKRKSRFGNAKRGVPSVTKWAKAVGHDGCLPPTVRTRSFIGFAPSTHLTSSTNIFPGKGLGPMQLAVFVSLSSNRRYAIRRDSDSAGDLSRRPIQCRPIDAVGLRRIAGPGPSKTRWRYSQPYAHPHSRRP